MDDLTEYEDSTIFKLEGQSLLSQEKDYDVQMDITIEMNLDLKVIARAGYTILDFISDVGGIQGMLISLVAWVVAFWNYKMFDNYMVSRLYLIRKTNPTTSIWSSDKGDPMVPRTLHNPREYCKELLMWSCCKNSRCFKSERVEKSFEIGRTYLSRETNIVSIVKSVRYFN